MGGQIPSLVADYDVVHVRNTKDLDGNSGLLSHLADSSLARSLPRLDVPTWQAPQSADRRLAAFDQQHAVLPEDSGAGGCARPRGAGRLCVVRRTHAAILPYQRC